MGSEAALRSTIKKIIPRGAHYVRVENVVEAGTPDCWIRWPGGGGWLELKHSHAWPKRRTTPVRCDHFTRDQRAWLVREGEAGGVCGVLWQVERTYMVLPWWAVWHIGLVAREELLTLCVWHGASLSWKSLTAGLDKCHKASGNRPV